MWSSTHRRGWEAAADVAKRLAHRAGTGHRFEALLGEARALLAKGPQARATIVERLVDRRFARGVAMLWAEDERLAERSMVSELVHHVVTAPQPRVSRLTAVSLAAILLEHFDLLDEWEPGLFAATTAAVRTATDLLPARPLPDVLDEVRSEHGHVLGPDAPLALARNLLARGDSLDAYLRERRLYGFDDGRFGQVARHAFYLAQIETADHTQDGHDVLAEVTQARVLTARGRNGLQFGHEVLLALTDKPNGRPGEQWLDAVLSIAGDPRTERTAQWNTWWAPIPHELTDRACRWMSGMDLRVFLDAVWNYAVENEKTKMQQMFARRKRFLEGLYESGLVEDSRLILGSVVRGSVNRRVGRGLADAADYVGSNSKDTAIIYLDCGDFQVVEGSHNFSMYLFAGRAPESLADRSKRHFALDDFRYTAPADHARHHPPHAHTSFTHQKTLWQSYALDFFERNGIDVDDHALLSTEDYAALRRERAGLVSAQRRWAWRR